MNIFNKDDLNFFNKKGYLLVKGLIKDQNLKNLNQSSKNILKKAINIKWPHVRVYRDYPHFFGKPNIFGVDYPLNRVLDENIINQFNDLDINRHIKELGNFENFQTELIRLHTNSNFFNYQGGWHRDHSTFLSPGYLQCVIYLQDENGFKVVSKDKNEFLVNYGIDSNSQSKMTINDSFINLPKDMFDVVNASAGDILFFEPGLLHQGFCKKYRLHYHMRFKKVAKDLVNSGKSLNFINDLLPSAKIEKKEGTYDYSMSLRSRIKRLRTFFLYFFPRIKAIAYNTFSRKKKLSIFHSTIWQ